MGTTRCQGPSQALRLTWWLTNEMSLFFPNRGRRARKEFVVRGMEESYYRSHETKQETKAGEWE
jgi:hypothetical protein